MLIGHVVLHVCDGLMRTHTSPGLEIGKVSTGRGSFLKFERKLVKVKF